MDYPRSSRVTRRGALRFLGIGGVAALAVACAPQAAPPAPASTSAPAPAPKPTTAPATSVPAAAAAPAAAPAKPTASAQQAPAGVGTGAWDQLVAAAKKAGAVTVATYAGTGYKKIMSDFEAAFPGITVEQTGFGSSSRDYVPRILQERLAGLYLWDVAVMPVPEMLVQLRSIGALDPVRPALIHPDVLDDKNWADGFLGGFVDNDKQWSYAITRYRSQSLWIDTEQVKEGEVKSYKDLLDPKWRGKMLAADLRTKGSGYYMGTALRLKTRDDTMIKQLFKDQEVVLSTDARQLTEFAARGRYPVTLGAVSKPILLDFLAQGVGKNLKPLPTVELDFLYSGSSLLHLINKPPHPNAAKLWANWVLTKEGSASFAKNVQDNSRRVDVPPFDPDTLPEKGVDYVFLDAEDVLPELTKTSEIAKQYLL